MDNQGKTFYAVVAQRTFTIDYHVSVWANNEHDARVMVEQLNDDIDGWEAKDECVENNGHEFDEQTPELIDIREI